MRKEVDETLALSMTHAVVAAAQLLLTRMTAIATATTHDEVDAL
jgi:hypothetical protein